MVSPQSSSVFACKFVNGDFIGTNDMGNEVNFDGYIQQKSITKLFGYTLQIY